MWTAFLFLAPVVAIAVLIWNFRRRAAAREAESAERMKAFLGKANANPDSIPKSEGGHKSATPTPKPPALQEARTPPLVVSGFAARPQLLSAEQLAIYHLLKSTLPEHEVLPSMSLSAFLKPAEDLTGFMREAQARRLADAMVDFLLCDKATKPFAAVQCGARTGKAAENVAFAAACVAATGMRWVEISPAAPPRGEEIKQLLGV